MFDDLAISDTEEVVKGDMYTIYFRPTARPDTFYFLPQVFRIKVNEYNKDHHRDKYIEKKYLGRIFQNFLETSILNLENTLNEIQSCQDNN